MCSNAEQTPGRSTDYQYGNHHSQYGELECLDEFITPSV